MVLNRFPWWKNLLVVIVVLIAFVYALPNMFGADPVVQVSGANATIAIGSNTADKVKQILDDEHFSYKPVEFENRSLLIRFPSTDEQLKAKELIQETLGNNYLVALNLAPAVPHWIESLGAIPMKLGLDLRGGVHFLMQVDADSVLKQRVEGDLNGISRALRDARIRYSGIVRQGADGINVQFRTLDTLNEGANFLSQKFPEFKWVKNENASNFNVSGKLSPAALIEIRQDTMEQAMNTLRNRVNELGVSEAIVQQQGASRIVVDLPGIQNTTEAKNILGKTATLEFHMVDAEHDARNAVGGLVPPDDKLYDFLGQPTLLKNEVILRGSSITSASSAFDENARPSVNVRLGGAGSGLFSKVTAENIGKPMAVLYVETKPVVQDVNGKKVTSYQTEKRVISVATIQSALGNSFQITGLVSPEESRTLALLLRAGALPAPVSYLEERQVGPSLGQQNIHMGMLSIVVGFSLVVIFMALYYGVMGIIADLALAMNLVLIVAIMSLLGATLTLPGIAGMVLTVAMAADANILIFERIREELRNGMGIQASIHAGYERAFVTIVDANITTLIVTIVLFSLGSGAVKSFAVTVTIGLITSMFTAITGTRAIVNWLYGAKQLKRISIGL